VAGMEPEQSGLIKLTHLLALGSSIKTTKLF
jgi:hypothetical protein